MKKKQLFLLVLCLSGIFSTFCFGTIRRVGFTSVPKVTGVDYGTFYEAHQAAIQGDTIYLWPGVNLLNGWPNLGCCAYTPISKRLVIISKGNWTDPNSQGNPGIQVTTSTATIGRGLIFTLGSEGSVLMGFNAEYVPVSVQANNITLKGNRNIAVDLSDRSINNTLIEGNYRVSFTGNDNQNNTWNNLIIRNNFIGSLRLPNKRYSGIIENNTWAHDNTSNASNGGGEVMSTILNGCCTRMDIILWDGAWLFRNNLIISNMDVGANGPSSYLNIQFTANGTFNDNVALSSTNVTQWPVTGIGNVFVPYSQVANIFEAFPVIAPSSADSRYRLKTNSPAKAGSVLRPNATVDAGMYGGNTPYKLGMIPSIPTIYQLQSLQGNSPTGNTMTIKVSTRSNN